MAQALLDARVTMRGCHGAVIPGQPRVSKKHSVSQSQAYSHTSEGQEMSTRQEPYQQFNTLGCPGRASAPPSAQMPLAPCPAPSPNACQPACCCIKDSPELQSSLITILRPCMPYGGGPAGVSCAWPPGRLPAPRFPPGDQGMWELAWLGPSGPGSLGDSVRGTKSPSFRCC